MNCNYKSASQNFLAAIALLIGGCTGTSMPVDTGETTGGSSGAETSTPTGAKLFTMITQDDPFEQWAQFSDRQGTLPSSLPHGPMSQVFINGVVESALDNFDGTLPDGSIIVKKNIGTDPLVTEAALTIMWKVAGFDPDNNDWFWANITTDGQIAAEGKVASCVGCHGGARANDFVFVHQF